MKSLATLACTAAALTAVSALAQQPDLTQPPDPTQQTDPAQQPYPAQPPDPTQETDPAQQPYPAQPPEAAQQQDPAYPAPATPVSDEDLETFAKIYFDVEQIRNEISAELGGTGDVQQAQEAQTQLNERVAETLSEHGWTIDRYNQVAAQISQNPEQIQQVLEMVESMRTS